MLNILFFWVLSLIYLFMSKCEKVHGFQKNAINPCLHLRRNFRLVFMDIALIKTKK